MKENMGEKIKLKGSYGDYVLRALTLLTSVAVIALILWIAWQMYLSSLPSIKKFGFAFLTSTEWDPVHLHFGALTFIYGTLVTSLIALAIAGPIGLGVGIFLNEMAPPLIRQVVSFIVEMLASIPSVVYGLWGIYVLAPILRGSVEPWLAKWFGFLPVFTGDFLGIGVLAGGLILAVMILPTIAALTKEVLAAVPDTQREAALALGATKWEMIRIAVLAYAKSGIMGGVMLGLGRALGETMAVTMVIGNVPQIMASLFAPGYSMASVIANGFSEASDPMQQSALVEVGLVLFAITLILNAMARLLVWSVGRGPKGGQLV